MKNVYYQGKLIPVKDWNFETKKPKVKAPKAAVESVEVVEETTPQSE
jgi:hypothetical protein